MKNKRMLIYKGRIMRTSTMTTVTQVARKAGVATSTVSGGLLAAARAPR